MLKPTYHFERRIAQRGISHAMVKWTIDNGEIKGDKFITTRKMVRSIVSSINNRMTKLVRLRKKFKHFGVSRLISKAIEKTNYAEKIALKIIAKGGVVIVVANGVLITAYDLDSYKKY